MSLPISVYFATMTGNAEGLARRACDRALNAGWRAQLLNLSEVTPADLADDRLALFIVSTWGDGDPPADAEDFWSDLEKATLALGHLRSAILGLGDRDYQEFNAFARKLDLRLEALGAERLSPRVEADLQFEEALAAQHGLKLVAARFQIFARCTHKTAGGSCSDCPKGIKQADRQPAAAANVHPKLAARSR